MNCCEILYINNHKTHELGCTESWKDYSRECKECGTKFKPEEQHQAYCSPSCAGYTEVEDILPWIHVACGWCGAGFNTQDDMEEYCNEECESLHNAWKEENDRD